MAGCVDHRVYAAHERNYRSSLSSKIASWILPPSFRCSVCLGWESKRGRLSAVPGRQRLEGSLQGAVLVKRVWNSSGTLTLRSA